MPTLVGTLGALVIAGNIDTLKGSDLLQALALTTFRALIVTIYVTAAISCVVFLGVMIDFPRTYFRRKILTIPYAKIFSEEKAA